MVVSSRLSRSRLGRAWRALREDEVAAEACGINAQWSKTVAFAISAGFGGLAGAMLASYAAFVDYRQFTFMTSVFVLCYIVLGGMGTVVGPVVGSAVLVSLGEILRDNPAGYFGFRNMPWDPSMRFLLYGVILIVMIRYRPEGLFSSRSLSREHAHRGRSRRQAMARTPVYDLRGRLAMGVGDLRQVRLWARANAPLQSVSISRAPLRGVMPPRGDYEPQASHLP